MPICSSLLVLALTIAFSLTAFAQAFDPMRISGPVTSYVPADCAKNGSITIAGKTFVIAAGANMTFFNTMQVINSSGGLSNSNVKSEIWQVVTNPATGRLIGVYLDEQNRVRKQVVTTVNTTNVRLLDITGKVTAFTPAGATTTGSVTIHDLTFTVAAGSTTPVTVDPSTSVRLTGTFNANNELTVTSVSAAYRKLVFCGAPSSYFSGVSFEVPDFNPFDPAGPISAEVFVFNPLGTASSQFLCDQSVEVVSLNSSTSVPLAPNYSLSQLISKDVNACYEFNIDAFNWISEGSQKLSGAGNSVSGTLTASVVQGFTGPFPTERTETQQRGSVVISGVTFVIAPNNTVALSGGPAVGGPVCLIPLIDPSGQNGSPLAPGWAFPSRAGQLLTGSKLSAGTCP